MELSDEDLERIAQRVAHLLTPHTQYHHHTTTPAPRWPYHWTGPQTQHGR